MNFYAFIPKLLNMSLTASVAIVFVLLLRLMLKKTPKVISYALWAVVLFRLLCPVSIESSFSLFGLMDAPTTESSNMTTSIEYVPENIVHTEYPAVTLPVPGISEVINGTLPSGQEQLVADPLEAPTTIVTYVWIAGVLVMAAYSVISYRRLRQKLLTASPLRDNIYLADEIASPFVMGLVRPKIYLPSDMEEREQAYIIRHEQHHIRRGDHIIKALAFLALSIHWFNPLVWVAFVYSNKDMEMSCDEAVVKKMGDGILADYTASLLSLATGKHIIAGMPLAFGEGDTKGRIRNLANWRKPAFWVVLIAIIACIALAVGLMTNPAAEREFPINGSNVSDLDTEQVVEMIARAEKLEDGSQLCVNADNFDLMFTPDFNWANDGAIRYFYMKDQTVYSAQLRMFHEDNKYFITDSDKWIEQEQIFKLFHYLDALKYMPQEEIRQLSPDADGYSVMMRHEGAPSDYERVLKYAQNGVNANDGWYIHLEVQPLHKVEGGGYNGTGDEVIHLFYNSGDKRDDVAGKTYLYEGEGIGGSFTITLYEDGTFTYYEGMLSSYIGDGTFMLDGDTVIMTDDGPGGYGLVNRFRRDGDDLVFVEQESDNFIYVKVKDGEKFHCTGEAFKQNNSVSGTVQIKAQVETDDVFFTYNSKQYDLSKRNAEINEITDCFQIGEYLVLEGHTGPKHSVYCIFNTRTETFGADITGANLTWYGDDINTVVYSYWSDIFTLDGRCLASYELSESEYIYSLEYSEDGSQIDALILSDTGDERTETISPNVYIVSYSDLNHNRVNEQIVIRTVAPGQVYELAVLEHGEEIWKTEASPAHVGWNTILRYSEDGLDYLVQYLPTMFQGAGSYTCTVFSLEGNKQTIKDEWFVDFELGSDDGITETLEMTRFAERVNLLMRNSTVLLSTEQGVLVDRHASASALPQIYPVRFSPDEIQQAMEAAANPTAPQGLTANAAAFPTESLEFVFASGAGGWGTYLKLQPDGRFTGDYGDSDMDTRYECKFEGQFADIQQISDYCWAMKLGDVTIEKEEGTTWTEDGIHYIASGPYGVSDGTDFLLYAPGTPIDLIPAACRDWWPDAYRWRNGEIDILNGWALCNLSKGTAFFTCWLS